MNGSSARVLHFLIFVKVWKRKYASEFKRCRAHAVRKWTVCSVSMFNFLCLIFSLGICVHTCTYVCVQNWSVCLICYRIFYHGLHSVDSTMPLHCTVARVKSRENTPWPAWRAEQKTSWWPQMWLAVVSTSRMCPSSSTMTWRAPLKVSLRT